MLRIALSIAFVGMQCVVFLFLVIIRYHLRAFALPHDARAGHIARLFTGGTILLFVVATGVMWAILMGDVPDAREFLQDIR